MDLAPLERREFEDFFGTKVIEVVMPPGLTELVINANKYAYGGKPGPIALEQQRNRFRLVVADRGTGLPAERAGFGTKMLTSMVGRLSGTMERTDNGPGLRVTVTAPIAGE